MTKSFKWTLVLWNTPVRTFSIQWLCCILLISINWVSVNTSAVEEGPSSCHVSDTICSAFQHAQTIRKDEFLNLSKFMGFDNQPNVSDYVCAWEGCTNMIIFWYVLHTALNTLEILSDCGWCALQLLVPYYNHYTKKRDTYDAKDLRNGWFIFKVHF